MLTGPDSSKPTPDTSPKKVLSRRKFLHLAGGAAAATAAGVVATPDAHTVLKVLAKFGGEQQPQASVQKPTNENKEVTPSGPKITVIDTVSGPASTEMMARVMGKTYLPEKQLIADFGQDYKKDWNKVIEKYPQALFMAFVDKADYRHHGGKVAGVMKHMWQSDGQTNGQIEMQPLQNILDATSITHKVNKKGDEGIDVTFDPQKIIGLLKDDPNKVVNGSFQVGEVGIFKHVTKTTESIGQGLSEQMLEDDEGNMYPGAVSVSGSDQGIVYLDAQNKKVAPITPQDYKKQQEQQGQVREVVKTSLQIEGAYTKEKALHNLPKVFEVCNAYPDKLFVLAAGNESEDIREAREHLGDIWPKNVLFVAQWSKGKYEGAEMEGPTHHVHGADIYVNNAAFGDDDEGKQIIPDGSSFSTPIIAAKAAELFEEGLSLEEVKEKLLTATKTTEVQPDESSYEAKIFDLKQFSVER